MDQTSLDAARLRANVQAMESSKKRQNPIRPTDAEAIALAGSLLSSARFGALGTLEDGAPLVTRIAVIWTRSVALSLVSDLSHHTKALRRDPSYSLLIGEPGEKGDPLTHPRLTLLGQAQIIEHQSPDFTALRAPFVAKVPKAKLYIDFGDFVFLRFDISKALLNGGFGKAYELQASDFASLD
ncbi:MAG: pyridoxamine 5'-phosphate oxidase family protein [Pseudomonadota bacterium]